MHLTKRRRVAGLWLAGCLLWPPVTAAQQAASACPTLPAGAGLRWTALDRPGLTFCKAIRDDDDAEVFAVTLSRTSPFSPKRSNREETGILDGREIRWYRAQIAGDPALRVRETLIELDDGRVAHIALRAPSDAELAARLKLAEGLRFKASGASGR